MSAAHPEILEQGGIRRVLGPEETFLFVTVWKNEWAVKIKLYSMLRAWEEKLLSTGENSYWPPRPVVGVGSGNSTEHQQTLLWSNCCGAKGSYTHL